MELEQQQADLATDRERHLTTGKRAERTKLDFRLRNLRLCHWSSQVFYLRAQSSTDVPVLLLNQPIVYARRTSTGSEGFSLLICLDATKCVLICVLTLTETICPKICSKLRLKCAKSALPVDVHRQKNVAA